MADSEIINIMIVDDHPVVRKGIKLVLENEKRFKVCAEASDADEAIQLMNKHEPDLAIIDIGLVGMVNGIDLIKSIGKRFQQVKTLVLSMYSEIHYIERAFRAGARGYVKKEDAPDAIIDAIDRVIEGGIFLYDDIKDEIIQKLSMNYDARNSDMVHILSDREFEIFRLIGNGNRSKEIAKILNISIFTVESHKRNMKKKLKLLDSDALLKFAIKWNIN